MKKYNYKVEQKTKDGKKIYVLYDDNINSYYTLHKYGVEFDNRAEAASKAKELNEKEYKEMIKKREGGDGQKYLISLDDDIEITLKAKSIDNGMAIRQVGTLVDAFQRGENELETIGGCLYEVYDTVAIKIARKAYNWERHGECEAVL